MNPVDLLKLRDLKQEAYSLSVPASSVSCFSSHNGLGLPNEIWEVLTIN